jgi:ferredoxin
MKVKVSDVCTGHGLCYASAPAVYELDDEGFNVASGGEVDVPVGLEEEARLGMLSCPEQAISVSSQEEATT